MLWATLSWVLPVTFGHDSAYRNAALALFFVMKSSAPCFVFLCHSPSSWVAIVHLSGSMPKTLRSSRRHPVHSFSCPPAETEPPTSSRTSRASAVSCPSCALDCRREWEQMSQSREGRLNVSTTAVNSCCMCQAITQYRGNP